MKACEPSFGAAVWAAVETCGELRPHAVAAGRARLVSDDWPSPLEVADVLVRHWFSRRPPAPHR